MEVDGGPSRWLAGMWHKMRTVSELQWEEEAREEELRAARETLDRHGAELWDRLKLTKLPPSLPELLLNAALWQCLCVAVQRERKLVAENANSNGWVRPPTFDTIVLADRFDLGYLHRLTPLVPEGDIQAAAEDLETRADSEWHGCNASSSNEEHAGVLSLYFEAIQIWEVACDGDVSVEAAATVHQCYFATARAHALQRLWSKYKAVASSLSGKRFGMENAGLDTFVFDRRDAQSVAETNQEIITKG